MLGDPKIVVKTEEPDIDAGGDEAVVQSEEIKSDATGVEVQSHHLEEWKNSNMIVTEWKDLRKYATVVQRGARGSGEKSVYKCSLCGKIMRHGQIEAMMSHIESKHFRGIFNHTCAVCEKSFDTKCMLNLHKSSEHAVRKFFSSKSTLKKI